MTATRGFGSVSSRASTARWTCRTRTAASPSSFATIKVAVPRSVGYNVEARTNFGAINAEVPINMIRRSDETLTGTINDGGCKMDLVNANGGVTITG